MAVERHFSVYGREKTIKMMVTTYVSPTFSTHDGSRASALRTEVGTPLRASVIVFRRLVPPSHAHLHCVVVIRHDHIPNPTFFNCFAISALSCSSSAICDFRVEVRRAILSANGSPSSAMAAAPT